MAEIVLVTEREFAKAEEFFRARKDADVQPAPTAEPALAEAVAARSCRAVIVGVAPYRGPLYEAIGQTAGTAGAIIARFGVGHDGIDKHQARQRGIVVTNTPGVLDASVAEHAMWLLGCLARNLKESEARLRRGEFSGRVGTELCGKTLGILGCGNVGRRVARIAHFGFSMRVVAADVRPIEAVAQQAGKPADQWQAELGLALYTNKVASVLRQADAVSSHLPATGGTTHFINAERLALMKPGALLVNTARGSVLDEAALYDALAEGRLAGAALDVFENEPYTPVSPEKDLRCLENVMMTPHIGSNTREANRRMAEACLENVTAFFAGRMEGLTRVD